MKMVKPIPDGFHSVTPTLVVNNANDAIEFYKKAFGANEIYRFPTPDGKIMHAMIQVGDSFIMLTDEFPSMGARSPTTIGGSASSLHLYVEDADAFYKKAVEAGAAPTMPIMDAFWGDRYGMIVDPYGHAWAIATHQKDMSPDEMKKAAEEFCANMGKKS